MDLLSLDANKAANAGAWIDILHPVTREQIGVRIKLLGSDSDAVRTLVEKHDRERLEKLKRSRNSTDVEAYAKERAIALLVGATVDWEGVELDGAPLACSAEAATRLYTHPGLTWLRDQVDMAIADRGNFLRP